LCNITIPVNINPINDQPFTLVTISPKISVIEGENVTITRDHLLTEDADTSAKEIRYDVISAPTQGVLLKISDEGYPQDIMTYGNQFSQSDINDQRIIYTHSGKPHSTSFYFKVSDGKFKPAFEIFNISILPITVFPGTDVPSLFVQQGSNMAELQSQHISVDTNVQKSRLMYNITRTPSCGMVVSQNKPTLRFNQKQLEDGKISYIQTDMSVSNDTFQVIAYIPDTSSAAAINVYIVVQPFIAISQILVIPGEKVRLSSTFVLDNPSQTKLNRYNPKIVITKKPKYGRLKKIIRSTGDLESVNDKEVSVFTYKELKSGAIYFVARKFALESGSINDSFEYLLTTKSAQPGQGVVPIELYSPSLHGATLDGVDIVQAQSSLPINLFVLVLFLLLSFLILILIIVIIMKCRSSNPSKNDPDKDLPPSLPRPPDFMTLNHNRMYTPSDNDSLPITTASTPLPVLSNIPHCKVIPIGLDSCLQDSDPEDMMDMNIDILQNTGHLRYPYGEDPEDWSSSCDIGPEVNYSTIAQPQQNTQQRANPLLRRNQYWV
jgi:chondroitin sulfate proteoglycan 4